MTPQRSHRANRISRLVYSVLLASYPSEIRRDHGREMMDAFRKRCASASHNGIGMLALLWASTLRDFAISVSAEWFDWIREHTPRRRNTRRSPKVRSEEMIAGLLSDLRHALRQLLKQPGFAAVAIATLALGIGANTAIFSVVNGVLLRPLPVDNPDRIVMVWESNLSRGWPRFSASPANYMDWVEQNDVFDHVGAYAGASVTLTGDGAAERLTGTYAWASVFSAFDAKPLMGRTFAPEENQVGNDGVAVISHRLWQSRFGGDPEILGRTITLNGNPIEVIGILPSDFGFRSQTDVWLPLVFSFDISQARAAKYLTVVARLKEDVSFEVADARMKDLAHALELQYPASNEGWSIQLVRLIDQAVGNVRPALMVLLGAVGVVLLIACANVANLLLARASARQQEMAVRAALGAGRGRLVRQLLTESVVLAVVGGVAGLGLAVFGLKVILALNPGTLPRAEGIGVDLPVLLFTFAVSVVTGGLFGLVPALQGSRADLHQALAAGGARAGRSRGQRARNALLVSQIAMALVLVTASGLLMRSFRGLQNIDPGFISENIVTMRVNPPAARYPQTQHIASFYDRLVERLKAVPGVEAAGVTTNLPLFGSINFTFTVDGRPPPRVSSEAPTGNMRIVTVEYLRTMGIPIVRGRRFTAIDHANAPSVVVVNESLVRTYFPDEDPLGQSITVGSGNANCPCEIVGVVRDVKQQGIADDLQPGYYLPASQASWRSRVIVARASVDAGAAIAAMREAVAEIDPDLAVYQVQTMTERLADAVAQPRFNTVMFGIFALVALVLAMVGVYGVTSYGVSQRVHELGVRIALGAGSTTITWLVVGRALALAGMGVGVGLAVAVGATRFIGSMLFEVSPFDVATFGTVAIGLAAVAALAAYLPARRAAKLDPVTVLRE